MVGFLLMAMEYFPKSSFDGPVPSILDKIEGSVSRDREIASVTEHRPSILNSFSIIHNGVGFFPKEIHVSVGYPVSLTVATTTSKSFCFWLKGIGIQKEIPPSKMVEFEFTPTTPSSVIEFHCPMDPKISGKIVVMAK